MRWLMGVVFLWGGAAVSVAQVPVTGVDLSAQVAALVSEPAVARAHWGVEVTALDGTPIFGLNDRQFFQPASNAKLFTTAAAMALLGPQRTFETKVIAAGHISADGVLKGDLRLVGEGDANLSGRVFPYTPPVPGKKVAGAVVDPLRYLEELADAVAAKGVKAIDGDVVGRDTYFAWEPYGSDWSADDLMWGYGAPASALAVNDNQIEMTIAPAPDGAGHASVTVKPDVPYYTIVNDAWSTNPFKNPIGVDRALGSKVVHVYGGVAPGATVTEELAIQDPAEYAAMAFRGLLEARGVAVTGTARAEHYDPQDLSGFLESSRKSNPMIRALVNKTQAPAVCNAQAASGPEVELTLLATHVSPPLAEDVVWTNKVSQNLHAEMMLRNVGEQTSGVCNGSLRNGTRAVREFLLNAGISGDDFVFYDGSGMSGHDLVTPRATAELLVYATKQPWFEQWKASLPVGGVDGSLSNRFAKAPLRGNVFAKTGTLGEARALSGYVVCASGKTVVFSVMVGNHAPGSNADRDVMDRIVGAIAAAN